MTISGINTVGVKTLRPEAPLDGRLRATGNDLINTVKQMR